MATQLLNADLCTIQDPLRHSKVKTAQRCKVSDIKVHLDYFKAGDDHEAGCRQFG